MNLNELVHKHIKGGCGGMAMVARRRDRKVWFCRSCCGQGRTYEAILHITPAYDEDDAFCFGLMRDYRLHAIPHKFRELDSDEWDELWGAGEVDRDWQQKKLCPDTVFNDFARNPSLNVAILKAVLKKKGVEI